MDQPNSPAVSLNESIPETPTVIKIIGVGGAGSNAVDRLKMEQLGDVPLAVINTDSQALGSSPVQQKCMIGRHVTRGLGTGGDPDLARQAAEADLDSINRVIGDAELVFLLAGMGGGTGSGAAPTVARVAGEAGALVIAFITLPFTFEGARRQKQAEEGLAALRKTCDAVIPLPNDILLQQMEEGASVLDAFEKADEWVARAVRSIWAILSRTGLINLDFATLRQVFCQKGGKTLFGLGCGEGEDAVRQALSDLLLCPLLHTPEFSRKADRLLVNIVGGPDLRINHVNEIMAVVNEQFGKEAHVALGAVIDEGMSGKVEICVLGMSDTHNRYGFFPRKVMPAVRPAEPARLGTLRESPSLPAPVPVPETVDQAVEEPPPAVLEMESKKESEAGAPEKEPVAPAEKPPKKRLPKAKPEQEEFLFEDTDHKGYFKRSGDNLHDGEDLDIPTFMRRGVRISLN